MIKEVPAYRIKSVLGGLKGFNLSGEAINGGFRSGRGAIHWPSLTPVKVKECRNLSGSSYELTIKGLKKSQIMEGDLLYPADWDGGRCRKALFYCPRGPEYVKNPACTLTTLISDPLLKRNIKVHFTFTGCLARAEFDEPVLGIKGGIYSFLRLDEPLILVARGEVSRADAAFMGKALSSWKDQKDLFRELMAVDLGLRGFALKPEEYESTTLPRTEKGNRVLIRTAKYKSLSTRLKKRASAMGGTPDSALKDQLERHIRDIMLDRGELIRSGRWLLIPGLNKDDSLAPMARRQLNLLREGSGYANPAASKDRGSLENWEAMGRMGLVHCAEGLVMTRERYEKESEQIVAGLKEKGPSELGEIRSLSSLSRRELLIMLEWMEKDGLILCQGDIREAVQ
jgi:hypothetical protein